MHALHEVELVGEDGLGVELVVPVRRAVISDNLMLFAVEAFEIIEDKGTEVVCGVSTKAFLECAHVLEAKEIAKFVSRRDAHEVLVNEEGIVLHGPIEIQLPGRAIVSKFNYLRIAFKVTGGRDFCITDKTVEG